MPDTRFYYPNGIGTNTSTGIVGVYRRMKKMRSGNRHPYYTSTVHIEKGNPTTRAVSITKHGELTALFRICAWRRQKMKEIYGDRFDEEKFNRSIANYIKQMEL